MGQTPRFQILYPEANQSNDVPRDIRQAVEKIDGLIMAELRGVLSQRPAAGIAGRYYQATDSSQLFRDNGTAWIEIPLGDPVVRTWTPVLTPGASNGIVPTKVANAANRAEYILDRNMCHIEYRQGTTFAGTASYDYFISLPDFIKPIVAGTTGTGITQNDGAFVLWDPAFGGAVSMRHARVFGGNGDLMTPSGTVNEAFTMTFRYR